MRLIAAHHGVQSVDFTRDDARWGIERDEQYQHDGLNRLMQADRGEFNGGFTYGGELGQQWALDHLGNWATFKTNAALNTNEPDFDDTDDVQEARSFNFVNELTQIVETTGASSGTFDFSYDANGNQTGREVNPDFTGNDDLWIYTYDAWNRLVKVQVDPEGPGQGASAQIRAIYSYYGLHQRATRAADADFLGGLDQRNIYYYDADWRLLEERVDDDWVSGGDFIPERLIQRVWCPEYIDSLIYVHVDGPDGSDPPDGDYNDASSFYALTDRLYSVLALVDVTGDVVERVRYTPYGVPQVEHPADLDGDGNVTTTDKAYIQSFTWPVTVGDVGFDPDADANQNGVIDRNDADFLNARIGQSPSALNTVSLIGNTVGYDGYVFDEVVGLYCVRNRWFDAALGRWMTRDPAGYRDGMNLYEYLHSDPASAADPSGLVKKLINQPQCTVTLSYSIRLIFEDGENSSWTAGRRERFQFFLKSQLESGFRTTRIRIYPDLTPRVPDSAIRPCNTPNPPCKKGWTPLLRIRFERFADFTVRVESNPTGGFVGSSAELGGSNAWLDEADIDPVNKISRDKNVSPQVPAVHEFGHLLGLPHPGVHRYPWLFRSQPNSPLTYEVDAPSLMGAGSELRPWYFKPWEQALDDKYPDLKFHKAR